MSARAAAFAAARLRHVITERGRARVVVATAASQLGFQRALSFTALWLLVEGGPPVPRNDTGD
jgi:hypothetical protein